MKRLIPLFLAAFLCCGEKEKALPPGYDGPIVSQDGQAVARSLEGKSFKDDAGQEWTVGRFSVTPYEGTKGPNVLVKRGSKDRHLPMEADGDAADLHYRVHGSAPTSLKGAPSEPYLAAWKHLK